MKNWFQRLIQWFRPAGRIGQTEVSEEFPVSPWTNGGISRGAGAAESYQLGPNSGVRVSPVPVEAASHIDIAYRGLLAQQDIDRIYVRCGEGAGVWQNVRDVPMELQTESGEWVAQVRASENPGLLQFCFHDGADHWDNNNGRNWSITVIKNDAPM